MDRALFGHRSPGRDESLSGDLTSEYALEVLIGTFSAEQVDLEALQVQDVGQQFSWLGLSLLAGFRCPGHHVRLDDAASRIGS